MLSKQMAPMLAAGVVMAVGIAGSGYFYYQYKKTQDKLQDPSAVSKAELDDLISKVGKLIALPEGETPTIATVTDVEKLGNQPFFERAKNGDKVLIYTNARKAILYDPIANKIVEVAPVNIGTQSAETTESGSLNENIRVAIYNGTNATGLTLTAEAEIKNSLPLAEVVSRLNASKQNYTDTIVVDLSHGAKLEQVQKLADDIGGTVAELPDGETSPVGAEVLVVLGADKVSGQATAAPTVGR